MEDTMNYPAGNAWRRATERSWFLEYIDVTLRGSGQVIFMDNPLTGLLNFIAIFWGSIAAGMPQVGIGAVLATFLSTATAYAVGVDRDKLKIGAIHDDQGFRALRQALADQYNLGNREPNLQVWNVDLAGDRTLTARYFSYQRRPLQEDYEVVLDHLAYLWGFTVQLEEQNGSSVKLLTERTPPKRQH